MQPIDLNRLLIKSNKTETRIFIKSPQMQMGQTDIADIVIDVTSRDDIPVILLGLQHIYTTLPLRKAVFSILEKVIPHKEIEDTANLVAVDANKGRPGMDQWCILVLGTFAKNQGNGATAK